MSGDRADPIELLYRDQGPKLWRAVAAWSGDPELASDAVSEAFTQLLGRGAEVQRPQAWVWRAAFKIAAGELKRRRRDTSAEERHESTEEPDEGVGEIMRALATLSPKQRAAIILHHYVGLSVAEVSRIIGSTPPAVRVHLSVGRRRLREALDQGVHEDV